MSSKWRQARWAGCAAALVATCIVATGLADDAPATAPASAPAAAPAAAPDEGDAAAGEEVKAPVKSEAVSDAEVVASMRKGIDFLLKVKKDDNWEINEYKHSPSGDRGGQTAIVLYALLHAGESLQDDPEYHSKLYWRGKELGPAVEWLAKNRVDATYAAGLQASALTLLNKRVDERGLDPMQAALDSCRYYFLMAMGPDGGYTYTAYYMLKADAAWKDYAAVAIRGKRSGPEKKALDEAMQNTYRVYGGPETQVQKIAAELRERQKSTKDPAELKKIEAEMKELQAYAKDLPDNLVQWKKRLVWVTRELQDLESRNGNVKDLTIGEGKAKRPMTKADIPARVAHLKAEIASMEKGAHFDPSGDLSNGQYGTLGAWAVSDYGMELPELYWKVQDRFWRKLQLPDGGWAYNVETPTKSTDTMTVAGIASLFVCQEFTDNELRLVPKPDKQIDAGLAWLTNQYTGGGEYYYMYGVERVGLSSGLKFFGNKDWYKLGATNVVRKQRPNGSWKGRWPPHADTAYALLFLARGRNPVVFNKLQYNGPWNARPRDNAYVTRWMSRRFEKPINWQVVNLQVTADEWQDAPILLITGSQDPKFSKEDIAKLREYVHNGGMIFSTSDGATPAFTAAMQRYASELVEKKYEMRTLPKTHELFNKDIFYKGKGEAIPSPPTLLGISNGTRELWIHSPGDLGADWQLRRYANETSFDLAAALYFYSSGMSSLRSKLQPLAVAAPAGAAERTIHLARLDYAGNSDPEPGAWPRMAKVARAQFKTQIEIAAVAAGALDAKKTPVAHLTGTTKVTFAEGDVKAIRNYLDNGGVLFMDAAGGNAEFAASARALAKELYPDHPLEPLSLDHPIYTGKVPGGTKLDVQFRKFGNARLQRRVTAPALEGVVANGRTRIIFSQWDICSGFLGTTTWGIVGYAPGTCEDLARNILLYSLNPTIGAAEEKASAASK